MKLQCPLAMLAALALAFAFCVNGCNTDETNNITTDGPPAVDVSGAWTGTYAVSDAEGTFDFLMTMDVNGEVEGTNTRLGRFTGDVTGYRFTIDSTDVFAVISTSGRTMNGTFTDSETGDVATFTCNKH
jgi:hypothetical protein